MIPNKRCFGFHTSLRLDLLVACTAESLMLLLRLAKARTKSTEQHLFIITVTNMVSIQPMHALVA
jgi:hypothetical protein